MNIVAPKRFMIAEYHQLLDYDQTTKRSLYAEAGIYHYWIVNLPDRQLECYSQPYQNAQSKFSYISKQISLPNQSVAIPEFESVVSRGCW